MTAKELRQKFLDFMASKGHTIISSTSLIPENDSSVLFTTAGMHPLVPYLMGEKHLGGKRVANVQKCIRTTDIDEVGDATHHTFFEMLGNWSFGDYFKLEALEWSWEFLTAPEWLKLDKNCIAVSIFAGDDDAPFDDESFNIWRKIGVSEKRIAKLPKKNNWWGPAGQTGPCGPDSEMFYWVGDANKIPESFNDDNDLWVEIWNDVFMEFNKTADGKYDLLTQKNVDTGMGLERTVAAFNGLGDNYRTELFWPIIQKIEELSGKKYDESEEVKKAMRIVADHLKAAAFLLAENLEPSNVERGYVLRRLIRRAIRYSKQLGIKDIFTFKVADVVTEIYRDVYPELRKNRDFIEEQLVREEEKFGKTLDKGLKEFESLIRAVEAGGAASIRKGFVPPEAGPSSMNFSGAARLTGEQVFHLYDTFGFPLEMTKELAKEWGVEIDEAGFQESFKKHQGLSRAGAEQKFAGGLADHSEQATKLHTAAHLLLEALRRVLGDHVYQKGSNITAERLRFDFSHSQKMTPEEIKKVENMVNEKIQANLSVTCEEMNFAEAQEKGAMGVFEHKYGEKVKVYTIGPSAGSGSAFSREICGGPHVKNTGELGKFRITKEESSSAGVRRIKAVLE